MAERVRTYSDTVGKFFFALAGLMLLLAIGQIALDDRLVAIANVLMALTSGLSGADQLWWRGTNRWFKPTMLLGALVLLILAGFLGARIFTR